MKLIWGDAAAGNALLGEKELIKIDPEIKESHHLHHKRSVYFNFLFIVKKSLYLASAFYNRSDSN